MLIKFSVNFSKQAVEFNLLSVDAFPWIHLTH